MRRLITGNQAIAYGALEVERIIHEKVLNRIQVAEENKEGERKSGACPDKRLFAVSMGVLNQYLDEMLAAYPGVSCLKLESTFPFDEELCRKIFEKTERIAVFEELEPVVEMLIRSLASKNGYCHSSGTLLFFMPASRPWSIPSSIIRISW